MGFDCGFDVYPRLEPNTENKQTYQRFIEEVINTYNGVYDDKGRREDGKILEFSNTFIRLMVGECPSLPKNPDRCDCLLRFSSKVSGSLTTQAEPYIRAVYEVARRYFGSRIHFWHELIETDDEQQWGYYTWKEVHDANDELKKLEDEGKLSSARQGDERVTENE